MNILCVDCGNSRMKWGLRVGGGWQRHGAAALTAPLELPAADRMVACNVAGERGRTVVRAAAATLGIEVEWLHSGKAQCGVLNGYDQPDQLGADRWAALIGARALHRGACLVVMCGTAVTIDLLDGNGRFDGGLILPGLATMRESLANRAADLPLAAGVIQARPRNTFDAIASGCINAAAGAIERMFRQLPEKSLCLISGGDAQAIAAQLDIPFRLIDNLVLEGLARFAGDGEAGPAD